MFDWLGDIISGIGSAIGDTIDFIGSGVGDAIWNAMLKWLYEIIYGAIADFFEMMGNMGSEVFDLEWVQATVKLFTLFGWGLFVAGTVVAVFDVAIEYQCGRANIKTTALNILKGFFACSLIGINLKKLNPKKVFIIADGGYREITLAEHEFRKETDAGYREKKFIGLHSMIMEVSEKEYIGFYRNKRRQKYLDEQRRDNGDVSYDGLNSDEFNGEEILIAELPDVCDTLVHQQLLDKLRKTVDALPEDEKALIVAHFYDEVPQTELAERYGVSQQAISKKIAKIRAKLKKLLEN